MKAFTHQWTEKPHKPLQNVIKTISRPPTDTQDIRDIPHSVVYWWVKFRRKQQCANLLSWQWSFLGPIIGRLLDITSPAVLVKIQRLVNCPWKSHWVSSWRNCRTSNASSPPSNSHHYPFFSWSSSLWLPTIVFTCKMVKSHVPRVSCPERELNLQRNWVSGTIRICSSTTKWEPARLRRPLSQGDRWIPRHLAALDHTPPPCCWHFCLWRSEPI